MIKDEKTGRTVLVVSGGIFSLIAVGLLFPASAYAYLDPGSGSYFFMMLVAGILAAGFLMKSIYRSIKNFLDGLFRKKPKNNR